MPSLESISRFEDRMKDCVATGKIEEAKIIERDTAGAAHRIVVQGEGDRFLGTDRNLDNWLRRTDLTKLGFLESVRYKVKSLMKSDLEGHILFHHLEKREATPLACEAIRWDIRLPKGQPSLDPEAARAIIRCEQAFHGLPKKAHRRFPFVLEGGFLGHATRMAVYAALMAQILKNPDVTPKMAAEAGFFHDIGKLHPTIKTLVLAQHRLSDSEYEKVKLHPVVGAVSWINLNHEISSLVSGIMSQNQVFNGILGHHLRPDGKGYPEFLNLEAQTDIAKNLAVIDTWDAITDTYFRKFSRNEQKERAEYSDEERAEYGYEELNRCCMKKWNKKKTEKQNPEHQFDDGIVQIFQSLNLTPVFRKAA